MLQANIVSSLAVKLHSQYRCRLVRRTPCACSPAVDGSVLIVVVGECIVLSDSFFPPRSLLGVGGISVLVSLELNGRIYRVCVQVMEAFSLACAESRKNS